ncbi:MAG: ABC transporter permease [Bacteroidales bacterium]|nr:ABC transporter permease [Bacteroidales bacterium]MCB9012763.1 ABC transporter permease [Bacteroidales bacterium]
MLRNFILSAFRNISRQKLYSFINIFGLAVSLMAVIFIFLWVYDELSFDRFHENADRLYRVEEDQMYDNGAYHVNVTPWVSGPVWQERIPEIEMSCRVKSTGSLLVRYRDKVFYEDDVVAADSGFFRMFSFPLIRGTANEVLSGPDKIVISDEMAGKYFGNEDPVGKMLSINNKDVFEVSGIFKKAPSNSSLQMSMIVPFDYMKKSNWYSDSWGTNSISTYVLLGKDVNPAPVDKKLTDIVKEFNEDTVTEFLLAPLTGIHLYSWFGYSQKQRGIESVYIFAIVAFFVLIIACINFMNLTTAYSATRSKEIGLRKVTGARRNELILQFLSESMVLTVVSVVIALILVLMLLPVFNSISGKTLLNSDLLNPVIISGIIAITLITGLLSGLYPALVLSSFKPVKILRGDLGLKDKKGIFRKTTVILQFSLTILLIIGTVVIYKQMIHMQNMKLGFEKENLFYIPVRGEMRESYNAIKEELKKNPVVLDVSASSELPHIIGSNSSSASWPGKNPDVETLISLAGVDYDFVNTMGIEMKSGRVFSHEYGTDATVDTTGSFLINEQMEKVMGGKNVVGMNLKFIGISGTVIGVMKDFHFQSARSSIEPLAIMKAPLEFFNCIIVRLRAGNLSEEMKTVEKSWDSVMPGFPFDYSFVDQDFDKMYKTEERMGRLMQYFAIISIIIASVGLFGLAGFTAIQKTKEIGVRKVMGASVSSIILLFSGETVWLMLISAIIACPLSWWMLHKWLQSFAYKTSLDYWIFFAAALLSLAIALLSIAYQAFKAANANPAEILKYE